LNSNPCARQLPDGRHGRTARNKMRRSKAVQ
jgi:hypothetical protein